MYGCIAFVIKKSIKKINPDKDLYVAHFFLCK